MADPIFGDSCIICHTIPHHVALVIKALKDRVTQLQEELNEARQSPVARQ
jgi:hypothetical protein